MRWLALLPLLLVACVDPAPVTFELENATGEDLFVQDTDETGRAPAWLRVFDGADVELRFTGAGLCLCPCSEGTFCDVECAAPFPEVLPLNDGAVVSFDWDGLERQDDGCVREVVVADEQLSVEGCAGEVADDPDNDGQFIAPVTQRCRRVDFARDAGAVRVVLD
jgi:hypothetical protein